MARLSPARLAAVLAAAIFAGSPLASSDTWPVFRHDSHNTGTSSDRVDLPLALAWRVRLFQPGGEVDPRPSYIVADDERAYVAAYCHSRREAGPLWAFDLETGAECWERRGALETGAVGDGAVFSIFAIPGRCHVDANAEDASTEAVWLSALDSANGEVLWRREIPWLPADRKGYSRGLACFNPQTVTLHSDTVYANLAWVSPNRAERPARGRVRPNAVGVAAFRAIDGTPIGQFWAPYTREHPYGDLYGSPVVTDDALYLVPGSRGGYILEPPELAWHGETVALERNFTPVLIDSLLVSEIAWPNGVIDLLGAPVALWPGSTCCGRAHSVTHIGGRPVVLKMDWGDYLVPFDLRTMERIWQHQIWPVGYYTVATGNAVIIAAGHWDPYRAGVYVIDLLDGEELWEYARPDLSVRYMAFSAGRVLAVAEDGFLYCFAPA